MDFAEVVEALGKAVEGAGVAIIVVGAVIGTVRFLQDWRLHAETAYRAYRRSLGRAILLGLEFLVAGDIIRTVVVAPTFRSVGVLAMIVAIRTFLSLELEMEIEGRFPWQRLPDERTAVTDAETM
jgi:uncharacterized membrane protein